MSLFECADILNQRIPSSCPRQGNCRECVVEVAEGLNLLTPRTHEERHLADPFRLACRSRIEADSGSIHFRSFRRGALRIEELGQLAGSLREDQLEPAVRKHRRYVLLNDRPIDRYEGEILGLALDIGTTTVVVRLVDLEKGESRASLSFENPQRFAGSDVMSRIRFEHDYPDQLLRKTLVAYLADTIRSLTSEPEHIYEVVVVGNSTMRDLYFGFDVGGLGQKPYRSVTEYEFLSGRRGTTAVKLEAPALGLPVNPAAQVYGLPLIGSHVGADTAACLLAIDFPRQEQPILLMDIGTNTEVVVGHRNRTLAASCPAGPAFEGGRVKCGMPALEGAIEKLALQDAGRIRSIKTIGDRPAEGICGSGLVDLLAELLRTGQMDIRGRLKGKRSFALESGKGIYLDEEDISHLAQAKAANASGLQISSRLFGSSFEAFEQLYLCGAFARHIDLEAARRIGLLPDMNSDKIVQLGNAAIEGATVALLSVARRRELEGFVPKIEHIELETDPHFFDSFVDGCLFAPLGSTI